MQENTKEVTVLANHARPADYKRMQELGMCYLRAGDSKGSLLVKAGFERLGYVCLHQNGEEARLYKLTKPGFQIWTAESLQELGFTAEHAPYYAVLRFDASREIVFSRCPQLKQRSNTTVAKIFSIHEFLEAF